MTDMLRGINTGRFVYHYTRAATAIEFILHEMSLRLSLLRDTNDPGDRGLGAPVVGDRADDMLFFELQTLMDRRMLACFSQDGPNAVYHANLPLGPQGYARDRMWAQYGDNHRGICLVFDREALKASFEERLSSRGIVLADKVSYSEQVGFEPARHDEAEYERMGRTAWLRLACERIAKESSFVKRRDWESEQEYRLLFIPCSPSDRQAQETIRIRGPLVAICVGHRFPDAFLPCIHTICDREKINAFQLRYSGDPVLQFLDPTRQPYSSPFGERSELVVPNGRE